MSEALGAGIGVGGTSIRDLAWPRVASRIREHWECVLLVCFALTVYQPWSSTLLPVTDFGTFLSERGSSHSVFAQFLSLARYYAADGRLCLVQYLDVSLATKAFGVWAQGWYWMYFVIDVGLLILARGFFLRTGVGRIATMVCLVLWATMAPTAEAWIRPTGEPFALIFMLLALKLVHNYANATDWRRRTFLVAACAIGIVYSKEVLVVLLPIVWLVSRLQFNAGEWKWARWTERDRFLFLIVAGVTGVALAPIFYVALTAPQNNYAAHYGHSLHPWYATLHRIEILAIPASPRLHRLINLFVDPGWTLLFVLPNLMWIRLVAGGFATARRRILWPTTICMAWIALGLLVYLPWPLSDEFYMLPFAFSAMYLGAHALSQIIGKTKVRTTAVVLASSILIVSSAVEARTVVYHRQLRAHLYAQVIDSLEAAGDIQSLVGATPQPAPARGSWAGNVKGFGAATSDLHVFKARDLNCSDAKKALESERNLVVLSTRWGCGKLVPNSTEIRATVPRYQWPWLWKRNDIEGEMYIARAGAAAPSPIAKRTRM